MKLAKNFALYLFIGWVGLIIVDMWFDVVSTSVFIKISVTIALLAIVCFGIAIARRNTGEEN